jgi:hypothetical protein
LRWTRLATQSWKTSEMEVSRIELAKKSIKRATWSTRRVILLTRMEKLCLLKNC